MSPERKTNRPERFTLETVTRIALEVVLQDGYHVPTLVVEGDRGSVVGQFPELPSTHEARVDMMHATGAAFARNGMATALRQVFFISEGWMSVADQEGPPHMRPSEDPHRLEVLAVSGLEVADGQTSLLIFEMVRDSDGQLVELKPFDTPDEKEAHAESPLLAAFVDGFRSGIRGSLN